MPLKILVVGAGVAGPALVSLLQRSPVTSAHHVTIVERFPTLRTGGQQIDIKSDGIPILEKMKLLKSMRDHCVDETGLEVVDKNDKMIAQFGVNAAGERGFKLTNEYEIMRGDMVRIFYEDSLAQRAKVERKDHQSMEGSLTYEFDKSIEDLTQSASSAEVTFSDGQKKQYDLVIAADGQSSRTRRLAYGKGISDAAFNSLGVHAAYFDIPRLASEGGLARGHFSPSRFLLTRTSNRPVTGANIFTTKDAESLRASYGQSIEKQKEVWIRNLEGSVWQTDRFIEGIKHCDDFYAHEQAQIKIDNLYKGRVVLLGDAGYCPSPFTGLGTTCALFGAYVLAGELARHGTNVNTALENYQKLLKPRVAEWQQLPFNSVGWMFPSSRFGAWVLNSITRLIYVTGAGRMIQSRDNYGATKVPLPEYPELDFNTE